MKRTRHKKRLGWTTRGELVHSAGCVLDNCLFRCGAVSLIKAWHAFGERVPRSLRRHLPLVKLDADWLAKRDEKRKIRRHDREDGDR